MDEFDWPTYVLDLRDKSNCSRIQSAKPGNEIQVLVRPEHDAKAKPIVAKGTRSRDGKFFSVVVTREDGKQQTHPPLVYEELLEAISVQRPD